MKFQRIGFIGCGNMGSALAKACAGQGRTLLFANRTVSKAETLALQLGGNAADNERVARECDLIFLGVKPQMMAQLIEDIAPVLRERKDRFVLVTMAACIKIAALRAMAGGEVAVIRIMPNTPVSVGEGMILWCAEGIDPEERAEFLSLMADAGGLDELPEQLMDAGSALSGCGPAFAYQFIEALSDGGVVCGLPRDKALAYAAQTLLGAARLLQESGQHPGVLKDAVCSPGGSTIQGVRALEDGGLRSTVMAAAIASYDKTVELGKSGDSLCV